MNNVQQEGGISEEGVVAPRVILNADVTLEGRIKRRQGFRLAVNLPNAHSLWGNRAVMLCAAEGYLYRIYPDASKIQVCTIDGPEDERLYYETAENMVYVSSRYWNGIFDLMNNNVRAWGIPLPGQPMLSQAAGSLPSGVYRACFTNADTKGNLGGNGQIAEIELYSEGGIAILNRPADAIVWTTEPNGDTFFYAGEIDAITANPSLEALPTFLCAPPEPMTFIRVRFGRMWGVVNDRFVYSEPYRYDLFKVNNYFGYDAEIRMVAATPGGFFIGFADKCLFLAGTQPEEMREQYAGAGVVKGTVAYCNNVGELGNNVPLWISKDGIVAGASTGQIVPITLNKVQFSAGQEGMAHSRVVNGAPQYMGGFVQGSSKGSGVGFGDSATCDVVRNGKVL